MSAYYNENDSYAAAWLRELVRAHLIPAGDVDERSIQEVAPNDLKGYTQCHFFAGIGGWPYALRLAGWPDDRPVWTGSCPCQPFSSAGKRGGVDDERHLWPDWRWLIDQCRPARVFGEQVASKAGRAWLAGVQADLEAMGYGTAAADLCAAGVGAPHIRQRLWWVAESERGAGSQERPHGRGRGEGSRTQRLDERSVGDGSCGRVADAESQRKDSIPEGPRKGLLQSDGNSTASGMADPELPGASRHGQHGGEAKAQGGVWRRSSDSGWEGIYIPCADGKARRIEPGLEPLVDGLPGRVGLLRGYGNAIVPQVAAQFIQAYCESGDLTDLLG